MADPLRVLVVEDSVEDTFFIVRELQRGDFHVDFERVETATDMQAALKGGAWDLIISDYRMPQFDGQAALAVYLESGSDAPFILVSGALSEERAVEMIKKGAHEFVRKDNLSRLVPATKRELEAARERRARRQAEAVTAYLASLVQSSDYAIIGSTVDGRIVTWNRGAERMLGYTALEVTGRFLTMLFSEEAGPAREAVLGQIAGAKREDPAVETVWVRKTGDRVEVSLTVSPVLGSSGQIEGASLIARRTRGAGARAQPQELASQPS